MVLKKYKNLNSKDLIETNWENVQNLSFLEVIVYNLGHIIYLQDHAPHQESAGRVITGANSYSFGVRGGLDC